MNEKRSLGYILTAFSAFIFGVMPVLANLAIAEGANPLMLVIMRGTVPAPVLALMIFIGKKEFKIAKEDFLKIFLAAILGWTLTMGLLYSSYVYIGPGRATGIHFMYPCIIMLVEIFVYKKKFHSKMFLSMAACIAGVVFLLTTGEPVSVKGVILAGLSAFAYAFYVVIIDIYLKKINPLVVTMYCGLINALIMTLFALGKGRFTLAITPKGWALGIINALLCAVFGTSLVQVGIRYIGGARAGLISTLEPITSIVFSIFILGEPKSVNKIFACVFIVISVVLCITSDKERLSD